MKTSSSIEWIGSEYGGFYVDTRALNNKSIVYSFGVGEDISFDLELIKESRCQVYAFDFTPRSIEYIARLELPKQFKFYDWDIADQSGEKDFYLPSNEAYVSGSLLKEMNTINQDRSIKVLVRSFAEIVEKLGHAKVPIDLVKMDIEGSEISVVPDMMRSGIRD